MAWLSPVSCRAALMAASRDQPLDPAFPPHTRVHSDFLDFARTLLLEEEAAQAEVAAGSPAGLTP